MRRWIPLLAIVLAACSGPGAPTGTGALEPPTTEAARSVPAPTTTGSATPTVPAAPTSSAGGAGGTITLPPDRARFDYQLGGTYPPPDGVTVVERDSTEPPAAGAYGICYVNAFQTQADEGDWWLANHPDLVLRSGGEPVVDPGWPDEYLLDTSSDAGRVALAEIVGRTIRDCAGTGYDAVELDNLDSYTRSGGRLSADGALDLAGRLVAIAHEAGLAVAQKNAAELSARARDVGFDLAIAEECHRWDECASYTDVYGPHVLDVEYTDDLRGTWADVCADPQTPASVVLRDRELVAPGDPDYAYGRC